MDSPPTISGDRPATPGPAAVPPLPAGTTLVADSGLTTLRDGRLLLGGAPLRFVRLSEAGTTVLRGWLDGEPVGPGPGAQRLARRLLDAGLLHPVPPPRPAAPDGTEPLSGLTVVIPVKDDQAGLDATLRGIGGACAVIVVDDGSTAPVRLPTRDGAGPELLRRDRAGGPGVARQSALSRVEAPLVAFVDAGVELSPDDLRHLVRWFADPTVVAVGPRISSRPGPDRLARYEARRSPLDLGPDPSPVGPGRRITYLPTATLVVRLEAVRSAGGFDPGLRFGEDVDLVWRLAEQGTVRYDPSVVVHHPPRADLAGLVRQRIGYGSSAGPLAVRHGDELAPVRISGWSLACWALALAGRPLAAVGLAAGTSVALQRKLAPVLGPDDRRTARRLTVWGHWMAGESLARAAFREWWPLTAIAWLAGVRRPVAALAALAAFRRWRQVPDRGDRPLDWALGIVDDAAYGLGVWQGAIRHRTLRCLRPRLTSWPGRRAPVA